MVSVAFQGEHGAYSEMAAYKAFPKGIRTIPSRTFREVFGIVSGGKAEFGIIPIENSTAGDILENYDLLLESRLSITGEVFLKVEHCLIGQKNARLKDIKKVYSHIQALAQSEGFLNSLNAEKIAVYDTAGAVGIVKESGKMENAAVASCLAADIYRMKVLKKGIQGSRNNTTRFFIIGKKIWGDSPEMEKKTSLVFMARHVPGALYKCLGGFAKNRINLTKIASRPVRGRQWEYFFYIDFIGDVEEKPVSDSVSELERNTTFMRVLGCYPTKPE
ncbi:prephenate dehydratase [Candidatus Woesearchaeota archaeon]|nr:prephenate dehydratase [Candidatus Woesearchaeota archaeon]